VDSRNVPNGRQFAVLFPSACAAIPAASIRSASEAVLMKRVGCCEADRERRELTGFATVRSAVMSAATASGGLLGKVSMPGPFVRPHAHGLRTQEIAPALRLCQ
jgi:hypothetical protein